MEIQSRGSPGKCPVRNARFSSYDAVNNVELSADKFCASIANPRMRHWLYYDEDGD